MDPEAKISSSRRRELPPIPQGQRRGPRALPSMPSQDKTEEMPVPKSRKKKPRRDVESMDETDDGGMEMGGVQSRRQSSCQEPLTLEPLDNPPQRRKKKKKAQTIDVEGDQTDLVSNGEMVDQNTDEEVTRRQRKRKVKPKVSETQSNNELDIEDDDVITDPQGPVSQHALFSAPQGQSQSVGKVFVEKSRRFQAADRVEHWKPSSPMEQSFMDLHSVWTTRDVSVRIHSGFRAIGLFSHGFLAGCAVWNITVVYVLAGEQMSSLSNLLQQYHMLAYPAQSLLYLLLALSTVSAFDRLNLAKGPAAMRSLLTLSPVALASFLYFSALVLSLSQQMTSDRINLYKYPSSNATLWPEGSERRVLQPWIVVNLVVTLLVGLAWLLMSSSPDTDHTEEFLMLMELEHPKAEEKGHVTA